MKFFDCFKKKQGNALSEEISRWNKFIAEVCSKDLSGLSGIRKNAVLCFWYDAEVNNGGHGLYFDCFREVKPQQLYDAIVAVGYKEIAENFAKAAAEGEQDDWREADHAYGCFSPSLCDCLMEYVEKHKVDIFG